jgi:hypothetical protein
MYLFHFIGIRFLRNSEALKTFTKPIVHLSVDFDIHQVCLVPNNCGEIECFGWLLGFFEGSKTRF